MTITAKTVKLPSGYRKVAHIAFQEAFQKWITVAHFQSQTQGQVDVYFMYRHGHGSTKPQEISRDVYVSMLREFYATEPKFPVNVTPKAKEPCRYCGELDCPTPSDCPERRKHIAEDEGKGES